MNWDAISAVGESVGALAVIVTLAYLALQVRVSRSVAADANRLVRTTGVREFCLFAAGNNEVLTTLNKAFPMQAYLRSFGEKFGFSELEAARVDWMYQSFFWLHYGQFASTNDKMSAAEFDYLARTFYSVPSINYAWENGPFGKSFMDPKFAAYIDALIAQHRDGSASHPAT